MTDEFRAGKSLLKFHKPESAPIPEFDPMEWASKDPEDFTRAPIVMRV